MSGAISSDGSEIWDWVARVSQAMQRQCAINELEGKIRRFGKRCGDCQKWMKSSECPMEKNVNGYNRGPSMNSPICSEFLVDSLSVKTLKEPWKKELEVLKRDAETPRKGRKAGRDGE